MTGIRKLFAIAAASACLTAASQAWAAPAFGSRIYSFADCNPPILSADPFDPIFSHSTSDSCMGTGISAESATSFTSMEARAVASDAAAYGLYGALNRIYDSVDVVVGGRQGDKGTLTFAFNIKGSFFGDVSDNLLFQYAVKDPGGMTSLYAADTTYSLDFSDSGSPYLVKSLADNSKIDVYSPQFDKKIGFDGTINVTYDVVFGDTLSYIIGQSYGLYKMNQPGDFFNKLDIQSVVVRDDSGAIVNAKLLANSGVDLSAFGPPAVPEPVTWVMMLLGFGTVGSAIRRRNSKLSPV